MFFKSAFYVKHLRDTYTGDGLMSLEVTKSGV